MLSAREIFEHELDKRKIKYKGPDSIGFYKVNTENFEVTINLENITKNYARDKDPEAVIHFIDQSLTRFRTPPWNTAKKLIFFSVEPSDYNFNRSIHYAVTDSLSKVLVITDPDEGKITWVTPEMIKEWNVSQSEAEMNAAENMGGLLKGIRLEVEQIDDFKLAMIPINSVFKASTIFSPNFKKLALTDVGWPVLVVIPCRDFIYIIPEKDEALLDKLGGVVQREYRTSGYPITTEVLKISDDGIKAIGKYPE